ncbi:MAG: U32 family peptidase, partial [Desulfovibrio sp.]|nr:U32 family peptidase [Desulfovibrio sp.]
MPSALAAFAAGADAVYLGLKHFSARMQAENFGTSELGALVDLAHERGRRVYVAMNTLVKPGEAAKAYRLLRRLVMNVGPDALIIQDLAVPDLARQAGFAGELHFSTLANITHQKALLGVRSMGAARVILPRELSFAEIRLMDQACPEDLDLELFVHGALCYCVSGRCWWSGYMGGKSGLRGRCVQPCRRVYVQKGREGRFFSCRDLSLDSEARSLLALPRVRSWKIEGRKKSPHYVYHVVSAYRLLRDEPSSAECRREAERLLGAALGRPVTRSLFLDAKASPTAPAGGKDAETSSGLMAGKIRKSPDNRYVVKPRLDLLPRDFLRVGYEDEAWHCTLSLATGAKKGQELPLALPRGKYPKDG